MKRFIPKFLRLGRRSYAQAATQGGSSDPLAYCRNVVNQYDYESWLCSYFYSRDVQPAYFALKAFYVELAMVPESVSNTTLGLMRMQFWRDTIKGVANDAPPRHPIALALHQAKRQFNIQPYHLTRIIDAREEELRNPTHQTMASLTSHAESTSSTLLYALLPLVSPPNSSISHDIHHAASHLGISQTIVTLLRALPYHLTTARNKTLVIPSEITAKHGVNQELILRGNAPEEQRERLQEAVYEFACAANDQLLTARDMWEKIGRPKDVMPIFLPAVAVSSFLTRLERVNFNIFHLDVQLKSWKLPWQIYTSYLRRKF
ncbi:hypothetical protein SISSUDRAFT_1018601 [Sistotremastrum suecicum HHB10207 ss-3]|uniref:Terpenoid synthase n=1 Tax=Sistotremastrum suecicum HHB10207 ss-3 TaxID=1314776 RepID=A0A166FGD4_9AGAM|nr:hypothetical protein SISSUDRAFT_1018601 [Sistotremastrum suecicum HHB10207 ss-3]